MTKRRCSIRNAPVRYWLANVQRRGRTSILGASNRCSTVELSAQEWTAVGHDPRACSAPSAFETEVAPPETLRPRHCPARNRTQTGWFKATRATFTRRGNWLAWIRTETLCFRGRRATVTPQATDSGGVEPRAVKRHLLSRERPTHVGIAIQKRKTEESNPNRLHGPPVFETGVAPTGDVIFPGGRTEAA